MHAAARLLPIAALLLGPAAALALEIAPIALPDGAAPFTRSWQVRQVRALEAETKARFAAKAQAAGAAAGVKAAQLGWDVTFYDLALDLDPPARLLTGSVAVEARVLDPVVDHVELDLMGFMAVSAVRSGGQVAVFSHAGDVLGVDLDRPYTAGEILRVEVDYAGDPGGDYFGWSSYGGQPLVWTLSEPYGARHWWPCKDVNTDKADSVKLHVTVPDPLIVASNGLLEAQTAAVPGRTTYHWTTRYPIATYLVSLACHPYTVVSDVYPTLAGGTMPVDNYLIPDWAAAGEAGYAVVIDQLAAFAAAFGEYPFVDEKYGHAHFPWGGGMEHQTCSSMTYSYYQPWLLAHELGHQWFGDMITCADFRHIWLNEGFATWCEAYWREVSEGVQGYRDEMAAARYFGPGTVYVEDTANFHAIFDHDLSYNKASWIVHMLRGVLGDDDFFAVIAAYREQYGFGAADTGQFRAVAEAVSGLDLGPFFQQWVYGEYYPAYTVSWAGRPTPGGTHLTVRVEQTQTNAGVFTMPLEIRVVDSTLASVTVRVQNSERVQWYDLEVPGQTVQVQLDPDGWVLCTRTSGGVAAVPDAVAAAARITGSAPNPFNPRTEIRWEQAAAGPVRLEIHDLAGRRVRTLVDELRTAGTHAAAWDGRDQGGRRTAAGTYVVRLVTPAGSDLHKIQLVK
ncbi:MAG: M1 family aminopeptidase [Candidatus Krumholzibacteriia bacterium]